MKLQKAYYLLCCIALSLNSLWAQDLSYQRDKIIEERIEYMIDEMEEGSEIDYTELFEQLLFYYENPINLNLATAEELQELNLLNDFQINNLLSHINKHGKLILLEELQSINGFTLDVIKRILPFTRVSGDLHRPILNFKTISKEGKSEFFIRNSRTLEVKEGFSSISKKELEENPNKRYLGSSDQLYTRYRFSYSNNISFGITAEKDAGEEFFKGSQKNGFDFYSAHLFIQGLGTIKQIAIGDFQAQFGQGLTFWSGMAFGRSPNVFSLKRNAQKLRPHTSAQESLFLRGGGITLAHKRLEWTIFYSSKKIDANISGYDSLKNKYIVSSFPETGFHRTPTEIENKNAVQSTYIGSHLSYNYKNFKAGLTTVHNKTDAIYLPREQLYNKFNRLSSDNTNIGIDYSYLYKNFNFFGEFSHSLHRGIAYTNGILIALDPRLSLSIQNRKFERDYIPIQSNAIGENSDNNNEGGTFVGMNLDLSSSFSFSTYVDKFIFPWLKFQADAPTQGHRAMGLIKYRPHRKMELYFQFKQRKKERNESENINGINAIVEETKSDYRLHFAYQITDNITLKNRIEFSTYQLSNTAIENGLLIYQDLQFKKLSSPLSFSIRYAIFDTDSWNSRIYAYENDVLYAYSFPAYSGKGSRFYISSKYHISRSIDLWLRFSQTYYSDREIIGSGKETINGNTKSDIRIQLRLKF